MGGREGGREGERERKRGRERGREREGEEEREREREGERGQILHWCYMYSTLCPISEFHDPVDSQRQLKCISPPVGRP